MISKVVMISLIVTMSAFLSSCDHGVQSIQEPSYTHTIGWNPDTSGTGPVVKVASHVESAADKLYSQSFAMFKQLGVSPETDTQSCHRDDTAVITIYSTNGKAQSEIDVRLDGSPVGSLRTYFPNDEPGCKSPSAEGVITLMVPAGNHTLEAASPNLTWPDHAFSVEKCQCMLLPLS